MPRRRATDWEQSVTLTWADKKPHKILGATINDPELSAEVLERDGQQEVLLKVPSTLTGGNRRAVLKINTDDELEPSVTVPVRFTNRPARPANVSRQRSNAARKRNIASRAQVARRSATTQPAEAQPPKGRPGEAAAPNAAPAQAKPPKEGPVAPDAGEPAPSNSE